MTGNDLEARSRAIAGTRVSQGNDYAVQQMARDQLLKIQAEQKGNLNNARIMSSAEAQNNANLVQAAGMGLAAGQSNVTEAPINPATQQLLSQYGYNQPTVQKTTQRSTQQLTKQNIVINNTTNNTTTNNVQAGPLQGRPVSINSQQNNMGAFRTWLSNLVEQQQAAAARRDAEYAKRDGLLARDSNRIVRKLEESSNSLAARLDPRQINQTTQSNLKTTLNLLGFGLMVKFWPQILEKIGGIEEKFTNYFGVGSNVKFSDSGLYTDLVKLFGGTQGQSLSDTLKSLGKEIVGDFKALFDIALDDRRRAIEGIPTPKRFSVEGWMSYLGNVLNAAIGGTKARLNKLDEETERKNLEELTTTSGNLELGKETYGTRLGEQHLTKDNELIGTSAAGALSKQLNLQIADVTSSRNTKILSGAILEGFNLLEKKANKDNKILVPREFFDALEKLGIDIRLGLSEKQIVQGKYVQNDDGSIDIAEVNDTRRSPQGDFYQKPISLFEISPESIKIIKERLANKLGVDPKTFSFDSNDWESIAAFDNFLKNQRRKEFTKDNGKLRAGVKTESDSEEALEIRSNLEQHQEVYQKNLQNLGESISNGQVASTVKNTLKLPGRVWRWTKKEANNLIDFEPVKKIGAAISEAESDLMNMGESTGWNPKEAVEFLKDHVKSDDEAKGQCALYVRQALNTGGIKGIRRGDAYTYTNELPRLGFEEIANGTIKNVADEINLKEGDIQVIEPVDNHAAGHIAMWDGTNWYSDFKQQNKSGQVWNEYPNAIAHIYRKEAEQGDASILKTPNIKINYSAKINPLQKNGSSYSIDSWTKNESQEINLALNSIINKLDELYIQTQANGIATASIVDATNETTNAIISSSLSSRKLGGERNLPNAQSKS